jgi:hypothetical protein
LPGLVAFAAQVSCYWGTAAVCRGRWRLIIRLHRVWASADRSRAAPSNEVVGRAVIAKLLVRSVGSVLGHDDRASAGDEIGARDVRALTGRSSCCQACSQRSSKSGI